MKNNQRLVVDDITAILELQIKTFESLKELEIMEMKSLQNTKAYNDEIEKLNLYLIKLNRIISNINCHPKDLEYDTQYILFNIDNYLPHDKGIDADEISSCLQQIIYQKVKELLSQIELEDEEDKEDYDDGMLVMQDEYYGQTQLQLSIINQIEILRIKKIDEFISNEKDQVKKETLIQYKYGLIRSNKNIADQLIQAGMNTDHLLEMPDDIEATKNGIGEKEYQAHKEYAVINYIEDSLECFELSDDIENKADINEIINKDIDFAFLDFLLNSLSTDTLTAFQTRLQNNEDFSQTNAETTLLLTQNILNQRDDYQTPAIELLENQECVAVREETLNQFISLIKLAELIAIKHKELCELEKENKKDTEEYTKKINTLQNYLAFEKELLQNIEMTDDEAEKLDELLTQNLYLILKNRKNEKLVKARIENMIPDLAAEFVVTGHSHSVYYMIHQTHHLKTLKKFQEMIDEEGYTQLRNKFIDQKYNVCAAHQSISDDMVNTKFDPNQTIILDDQTISELLNVSELEYASDKDEELYAMASQIMYEMLNTKQKNEGYIYYQTLCIEEILNGISLENILALEEQYNTQINAIKINKENPEKSLRLKPLFKKAKPEYLKK